MKAEIEAEIEKKTDALNEMIVCVRKISGWLDDQTLDRENNSEKDRKMYNLAYDELGIAYKSLQNAVSLLYYIRL